MTAGDRHHMKLTDQQIEAGKSPRGAWTYAMTETEYVSQMLGRMRRFADAHGCQVILVAMCTDWRPSSLSAATVLPKFTPRRRGGFPTEPAAVQH